MQKYMQNYGILRNKRIAFFGTPGFTVEFLELFKNIGLDISLIVTGEDKPVGRGQFMKSPGPKIFAEKNNTKYLQPKKLDVEFFNYLEKENFDLFIVIAYGKIIPERIINLPKRGTINLHYSLLPKYRGASPVESAILNGEKETGITFQQMVYKLDAGNILFQENMDILETETASELRERMNRRAIEIFPEFLDNFFSSSLLVPHPTSPINRGGVAQIEQDATSCGKFSKEDFDVTLDLEKKDLELIFKKYRAFDKRIFFFYTPTTPNPSSGRRGISSSIPIRVKITEMNKDGILKVLPESRKEISVKDFENSFGKIY